MVLKPITSAKDLQGTYVALITPLRHDDPENIRNSIDNQKFGSIANDCIESGADGLVAGGTTGQSPTMKRSELITLTEITIRLASRSAREVSVIVGAGTNNTEETMDMIRQIEDACGGPGVALLSVTGSYNKPSQEGLYDHFATLASKTHLPIILYNVPGRTSSNLAPQTIIDLAKLPGIIGLKQATPFGTSPAREELEAILAGTNPDKFRVLSGEDALVAQLYEMGGHGVISATANIPDATALYREMKEAYADLNQTEGRRLQSMLTDLFVQLVAFPEGVTSPGGLSYAFNSAMRLPMATIQRMTERGNSKGIAAKEKIDQALKTHMTSLRKYH